MPTNDLLNIHFSAADITAIDAALATIEATIKAKVRNLTPEERTKWGSINETNKLLVNKVRDYRNSQPTLSSPDIDWVEFEADWQDRTFCETRSLRLAGIVEMLTDTKILHDYDNYQNALVDYNYTKYKSDTDASGYTTKAEEIKQFFPNVGGSNTTTTENPPA